MLQQPDQVFLRQRLEDINLAPAEQRAVYFKGRIFRGGPDERDNALFHRPQQSILLPLVEPVDLVDEQDRPGDLPGFGDDLPYLLDPGRDGAERVERYLQCMRNDTRDRRLSGPRRPPKDHRRRLAMLDSRAQYTTF